MYLGDIAVMKMMRTIKSHSLGPIMYMTHGFHHFLHNFSPSFLPKPTKTPTKTNFPSIYGCKTEPDSADTFHHSAIDYG